jgi:hypothetical protein
MGDKQQYPFNKDFLVLNNQLGCVMLRNRFIIMLLLWHKPQGAENKVEVNIQG